MDQLDDELIQLVDGGVTRYSQLAKKTNSPLSMRTSLTDSGNFKCSRISGESSFSFSVDSTAERGTGKLPSFISVGVNRTCPSTAPSVPPTVR